MMLIPSPLGLGRLPRVIPGVAIAAAILPFAWPSPAFNPAGLGFTLCFDIGGLKDMSTTGANSCNVALAGVSGQPGGPIGGPMTFPGNALARKSYILGSHDNIAFTRQTHREMWVREPPAAPQAPFIRWNPWLPVYPYFPGLDYDPNYWLPLSPLPFFPPQRPPVWPNPKKKWVPKNRKAPRSFPSGEKGNGLLPDRKVEPKNISISESGVAAAPAHTRGRPIGRNKEGKYRAEGPFAALAAALLRDASNVYNGITEAVDLLSAIYSAIPANIIAQQRNDVPPGMAIPFMLGMIWQYRNQIDVGEAARNIIKNQVEDAMWGRYFGAVDKVSRSGTNYAGFDRELGQLNEVFKEIYG